MCITKIKHFNSRLYFYYINNGIDPLIIAVDLNKIHFIIVKGQSYIKLPKKLWDRIKQIKDVKKLYHLKAVSLILFILPC